MRIAFLTDTYSPEINGIVTSITNFTENLAKNGHQVLIIAPKYNRKHDHPAEAITIKRYSSFSFASNKETHIAYPQVLRIVNDLKEFKPDVIHVQTPMSIGVAGVMAGRLLKVPIIQTYHTYLPDFMVYLSPYNLLGLNKVANAITSSKVVRRIFETEGYKFLDNVSDDIKKFTKRLSRRGEQKFSDRFAWDFTRFLYNKSDLVLAPSEALVHLLNRHGIKVPAADLSNGIEFDSFKKKTRYGISGKFVHVGRLGLEKGTDIVLKSFAKALKRSDKLTLDIYGDGPAKNSLIALSEKLGISEKVNFVGFTPRKELKKKLWKYDCFVTASPMETQGLVILEAMAAGLPVIGVHALAVPELVHDKKNGYLVPPHDISQMAEAMLKMVEDRHRNARFGAGSLEIAETHNLPNCYRKLEQFYSDVKKSR